MNIRSDSISLTLDCVDQNSENAYPAQQPAAVEHVPAQGPAPTNNEDDGSVHALAEAYPHYPQSGAHAANDETQANGVVPQNDDVQIAEQPEIHNQNTVKFEEPILEIVTTEEPALFPTTVQPLAFPTKKKKKVTVALSPVPEAKNTREEDEEDDEVPFFYKPQKANPSQTPYSFFPLNFGDTSGGAIAVANAFSTGKGGASSHAIAYGSPSSKKGYKRYVQPQ